MPKLRALICVFCVVSTASSQCPLGEYNATISSNVTANRENDQCSMCNIQCTPQTQCSGPENTDCAKCRHFVSQTQCVSSCPAHYVANKCVDSCPDGTYSAVAGPKAECLPCPNECNQTCMGIGNCLTSGGGLNGREKAALIVGLSLLVVVIALWFLLYFYVKLKRLRGGHNMKDTKDTTRESASEPRLAIIELTQSAFAVNPTQYADDWIEEQEVTTVDWLSGEQRVTLDNPLFKNSTNGGSPSRLHASDDDDDEDDDEILNQQVESSPPTSNFTNSPS
ncbi:receptor tyrosine-protein kinase erbB-2-like [Oscarella lobularis]|uniref:receptor tyrosine-protein kinase erbB-2-like n=1 Tax=Oscarella lobularis TaxID=121494 RepID=UPI003313A98C